jgi:hypothetical protein
MNRIGRELAYDTLKSRRDLVVEILGETAGPVKQLIKGIRLINYRVEIEALPLITGAGL